VVAAVEEELVGIQPLVGVQKQRDFGRPGSSIDEVAVEEEVVLFGGLTGKLEDIQQIKVLA
jgi:preprotein translocase subunit YajC